MQKKLFKTYYRAAKELENSELTITRPDGVIVENPLFNILHKTAALIIDIEREKMEDLK